MGVVKAADVAAFEEINKMLRMHAACRGSELLAVDMMAEEDISIVYEVDPRGGWFCWLATVLGSYCSSIHMKKRSCD